MKFNDVVDLCKNKKKIYIFGHINPDGDCIGATIALKLLLEKRNIYGR